jgi:hypothetical protein
MHGYFLTGKMDVKDSKHTEDNSLCVCVRVCVCSKAFWVSSLHYTKLKKASSDCLHISPHTNTGLYRPCTSPYKNVGLYMPCTSPHKKSRPVQALCITTHKHRPIQALCITTQKHRPIQVLCITMQKHRPMQALCITTHKHRLIEALSRSACLSLDFNLLTF